MKGKNSATLRQEREPSSVWRQRLQKAAGRKEGEMKGTGGRVCSAEKETCGLGEGVMTDASESARTAWTRRDQPKTRRRCSGRFIRRAYRARKRKKNWNKGEKARVEIVQFGPGESNPELPADLLRFSPRSLAVCSTPRPLLGGEQMVV
jgi:hypothetical protein